MKKTTCQFCGRPFTEHKIVKVWDAAKGVVTSLRWECPNVKA